MTKEGYNAASRTYLNLAPGFEMKPVSQKPTNVEVTRAKWLLLDNVLVDFPYSGPNGGASEKAHALLMFLQPFFREMVDATPAYLIEKPTPGTGCSLLINVHALITEGRDAKYHVEKESDEEYRKAVTSALLAGSSTFVLDNLAGTVNNPALAQLITSSQWTDRVLGASKEVTLPNQMTIIFGGNNPTFSNEMTRRLLRVRLDANMERPEERTGFVHDDLEPWVKENRAELVWAALTLIQAWVVAGQPKGKKKVGSFQRYCEVAGGILDVIGVPGFLENREEMAAGSDEEGNAIRNFLSVWWAEYGESLAGYEEGDIGSGRGTGAALAACSISLKT